MKKKYIKPVAAIEWVPPYLMSSDTSANLGISEDNPEPGQKPW